MTKPKKKTPTIKTSLKITKEAYEDNLFALTLIKEKITEELTKHNARLATIKYPIEFIINLKVKKYVRRNKRTK